MYPFKIVKSDLYIILLDISKAIDSGYKSFDLKDGILLRLIAIISGIKTHLFETDWHIDEWNADVHVKYYWSDVDHWSGTSGKYKPLTD